MVSAIMIKLLSLTIAAALFIDYVEAGPKGPPCNHLSEIVGWTEWFDIDDPSSYGDLELLSSIREQNPGKVCTKPVDIEARTLSGLSVAEAGEQISSHPTSGFVCRNVDQPDNECNDYEVRFSCPPPSCSENLCWTNYFNRDNSSEDGDRETLSDLRAEYPGEICDNPLYIQAVTTDTMTTAINTGQNFFIYNPTEGFVCRNEDQRFDTCKDYRVRFVCPCE